MPTHFMVTAEFRWGACWRKRAQLKRPINVPPVLLAALSKPEQENDAAESLEWLWALRARDVEALFAILNRDAEAALVDRALEAATGPGHLQDNPIVSNYVRAPPRRRVGRAKGIQVRRVQVAANVIRSGRSGDFNVGVGEQATLPMTWLLRQSTRGAAVYRFLRGPVRRLPPTLCREDGTVTADFGG